MATQKRRGPRKRRRKEKLRYFYTNGELHKALHVNRPADILTAWSYPQHKRVGYTYSDVLRNHGKAFTLLQVAKMLNRTRESVEYQIIDGNIPAPQYTYTLDEREMKHKYMFSEEDVLRLHEYYSTLHFGRPRKDGCITPWPIPTAREVRAMMRQEVILYVKTEDGFVPTWEAEQW